jgi:molybdate transport system ATP-binding protein
MGWCSPELHLHYPADWRCLDVVCSGFSNSIGLFQPCPPRQRAAARRWLDSLGLGNRATDAFGELSFGDQRLVLLARALVKQPELVMLDEPCQGLDAGRRRTVLATVDGHIARTGNSLIFVTHHAGERPRCITHRLRMRAGRIVETARLAG